MSTLTLTPDALELYRLIHRGGEHVYLWGKTSNKDSNGTTRWFHPGERPALFNSNHNNYHGVHPTTKPGTQYQRAKKGERDIAVVNCVYADLDDKDYGGCLGAAHAYLNARIDGGTLPRPTTTINSGGGVQLYWGLAGPFVLDTPEQRDQADTLQKRWVAYVGGDDGAKDAARVLRVPGTLNFKYDPPRPVDVIEADYSRLYSVDELDALLPTEAPVSNLKRQRKQRDDRPVPTVAGQSCDFTLLAEAAQAIADLHPSRRDDRNMWRDVGMALHATFGDVLGLPMFDQWSRKSAKYDPIVLVDQWRSFRPDGGITIGTLFAMAEEDRKRPGHSDHLTEEQWTRRLLDRTDIPDRLIRLARAVYRFMHWRRREEGEGAPIRAYPQQFANSIDGSKGNVSSKLIILEQMGLIIRESYTYEEAGKPKGALYLLEGPAFDDPDLLTAPEGQGKSGGDRRSADFKEQRRCPEHPDALVRMTVHRVAEYHCVQCAEEQGSEPEPFFTEDLPPIIRTLDPQIELDRSPDDEPPDTRFKFETINREQFKTETFLPPDHTQTVPEPPPVAESVSNLKRVLPRVRCICGGRCSWVDNRWICDTCAPPRARHVPPVEAPL